MVLYSIGIVLMAAGIYVASLFNKKARQLVSGHSGIYKTLRQKADPNAKYLWFHAASLGEFEQGRPIIEAVRRDNPEYKILLTFFSPSGYEVRKDYAQADIVCYIPFDTTWNARKFLSLINIERAFFIKYEFWPNFLRVLHRKGIRTYSVSSIFRQEQHIFKWYGYPVRRALHHFDHLYVQDDNSRDLLAGIGIKDVTIVGDTRADRVLQIAAESKELPLIEKFSHQSRVFIAGSSWPADEDLFIQFFMARREWKLIIAPHVIDECHLAEIEHKLAGRRFLRYSKATEDNIMDPDVLIIDCFGLLSSIYRYGEIAYIGGGFGVGIHNTLEAAVYGIPVIFGPNNQRFREARQLIQRGGGFEITDFNSLKTTIDKFISDPAFLKASGKAAGDYVLFSKGTSEQIVKSLKL